MPPTLIRRIATKLTVAAAVAAAMIVCLLQFEAVLAMQCRQHATHCYPRRTHRQLSTFVCVRVSCESLIFLNLTLLEYVQEEGRCRAVSAPAVYDL